MEKIENKDKDTGEEIAFDLIQVYAKRKLKKGFQYIQVVICNTSWKHPLSVEDTPISEMQQWQ